MSGSIPGRTSTGSRAPADCHGAVRRREGRCLPRIPPAAAGVARPQDRPRDPQHDHGSALVPISLLHSVSATGSSSAIIRSRPSASARDPEGEPTSAPPSRSGPRGGWSMRARRRATITRSQTLTRAALRQLARVRPGGRAALLCASAPRGRHDQVEPQPAARRGHRLALLQRAQARAEGVRWRAGGLAMLTCQGGAGPAISSIGQSASRLGGVAQGCRPQKSSPCCP